MRMDHHRRELGFTRTPPSPNQTASWPPADLRFLSRQPSWRVRNDKITTLKGLPQQPPKPESHAPIQQAVESFDNEPENIPLAIRGVTINVGDG